MGSSAYISIIRPVNCTVAGIAGVLAYFIVTGSIQWIVLMIWCMVFLITAAGNVINDYYDAAIDAINRPERPIPSGAISQPVAQRYATFLFLLGNLIGAISLAYEMILPLIIALWNSILLWWYAKKLKTTPGFGNAAVAYLSASIFLFGAAFTDPHMLTHTLTYALPIAGATFGVMLAREIMKDAEDVVGDLDANAKTIPIQYGIPRSIQIASCCAICGIILSLSLFFRWGLFYLGGIIIVDLIILFGVLVVLPCTTPECVRQRNGSRYLKYGMFCSLIVFFFAAAFL
ncbi:MAG: UbiA family prenyltransferase [Methanomicrobiales archaeon]|jgi:geranylgeranylglycerol-phosphate geranylgeranyltransferase|nr:UbiA family prenyltransferase [Methanomicrobiales archaeon]